MRTSLRTFVAYLLLLAMGTAVVLAATQNRLAKYDVTGTLVDSVVYESGGNVGIGTTTPGILNGTTWFGATNLEVKGNGISGIAIDSNSQYSGLFINDTSQSADNRAWGINGFAGSGKLSFVTSTDGGHSDARMVLDRGGNVGIGTTAPSDKLHVAGNVRVDGNIAAKYQDVAEWVVASEPASAGTVVIADPDLANQVRPARVAYDTAVAGVVSAQAGILLGEPGIGTVAVSQSGRVRVKVDAGYGAIRPGDLLVTSPTAGYARRSSPLEIGNARIHQPGTILGKALEPLEQGTGDILVLLTLQ